MSMTYTQLQDVKNRVIRDLANHQASLAAARGEFTRINNALTGMQTEYAGWATEIDQAAAQFPTNAAVMALKAEKDIILAEFTSTKAKATALAGAVDGVG